MTDIPWNFENLTREFQVNGRKHVLRGASQSIKTAKKQHLFKALEGGVHLSTMQICDNKEGLLHSLTTQATRPTVPLITE